MIKIACHSLSWANYYQGKTYDLKKVLTEMRQLGYDGVELVEPLSKLGEVKDFKKVLHFVDLELASLSCSLDREARGRIDYLSNFDTGIAMLCGGWITKGEKRHGLLIQSLRQDLGELAEYAKKQDIDIAFHPHKGTLIETREDLEDFYSDVTDVKLCIDIAHLAACGSDPLQVLKEFRNRIAYIHLKDYDFATREFVELGCGSLNLKPILMYLKRNYSGWLTVEQDITRTDPVKSARTSRSFLAGFGL